MAAYSYKEVMFRADYTAAIKPAMESCFKTEADYDADAGYDGDGWTVTAFLLDQKDAEIERLKAALTKIGDPLILDVPGTGTARALSMITAMQSIAKEATRSNKPATHSWR